MTFLSTAWARQNGRNGLCQFFSETDRVIVDCKMGFVKNDLNKAVSQKQFQ